MITTMLHKCGDTKIHGDELTKRFKCIAFIFMAICLKEQDHLGDNLHVLPGPGGEK